MSPLVTLDYMSPFVTLVTTKGTSVITSSRMTLLVPAAAGAKHLKEILSKNLTTYQRNKNMIIIVKPFITVKSINSFQTNLPFLCPLKT